MPKRQKHRTSEKEIEKAIEKAHRKIMKLKMQAQCYLDMEELAVNESERRKSHDEADMLLGKISRLENTRLPKLGLLLSEFRTIPLGERNGVSGLNEQQVVLRAKE